jgi:hypothetical protein
VVAAAGSAAPAMAQTDVTWSNPAGGVWSQPMNWSPMVVPNNGGGTFNATLSLVGGAYLVSMDIPVTIENFTMDEALATLDLTTNALTINQSFTADVGTITSTGGGGTIVVAGQTVFGDVLLVSAGQVQADGSLSIVSPNMMDICDTDVGYGGTGGQSAQWQGSNTLSLNSGGTFTNDSGSLLEVSPDGDKLLAGDGTGSLTNDGEMVLLQDPLPISAGGTKVAIGRGLNPRGGARASDLLSVDAAGFFNNGGVTVFRGGLDLTAVVNDQTLGGELVRGRWTIDAPVGGLARVVFPTRDAVSSINTRVTLLGEGSVFSAIDGVSLVGGQGRFEIGESRGFTTQGPLTVLGELVVGQTGFFDAQNGLNNITGGILSNGTYSVAGTLLAPSFASVFALSQCTVRLIGPNSAFPVIDSLQVIGSGATFSVESGRFFATQAGLQVAPGGRLRIADGSGVLVNLTLINASNGVLTDGEFEIAGALRGGLLPVSVLQGARLALHGPNSQIIDDTGADAIAQLQLVDAGATLEVRAGKVLETGQPFTLNGTLIVDPVSSLNPVPVGVIAITEFKTLDAFSINTGSTVQIGVSASGTGGLIVADSVVFESGLAGKLVVTFEPGTVLALPYTRTVIQSSAVVGQFVQVLAVGLDPTLALTEVYDPIIGVQIRVELACPADMNGDGVLDNGDIGAFVAIFLNGDLAADFNGDGILDNGDIGAFVAGFLAGC